MMNETEKCDQNKRIKCKLNENIKSHKMMEFDWMYYIDPLLADRLTVRLTSLRNQLDVSIFIEPFYRNFYHYDNLI